MDKVASYHHLKKMYKVTALKRVLDSKMKIMENYLKILLLKKLLQKHPNQKVQDELVDLILF